MIRPQRIKRPRMGVRVQIDKIFMRHRKWVKGFGCAVAGAWLTNCECGGGMEFAHIRNAANSGKSTKPHDAFGYGLCSTHHAEEHRGAETFARKYGIDPYKLAAWFLRNSPDRAMRESFYQLPGHVQRTLLEAAWSEGWLTQ